MLTMLTINIVTIIMITIELIMNHSFVFFSSFLVAIMILLKLIVLFYLK